MTNNEPLNESVGSSNPASGTKRCPFCREFIIEDALKCKHCGSVLVPLNQLNPPNQGGGNTVQIVTNTVESKSTSTEVKTKSGQGWAGLIVTIITLLVVFGQGNVTPDWAQGLAILSALIVVPWMIWVLAQPNRDNVLPIITLLIMAFVVIGAYVKT